jgi:hypothetical protein
MFSLVKRINPSAFEEGNSTNHSIASRYFRYAGSLNPVLLTPPMRYYNHHLPTSKSLSRHTGESNATQCSSAVSLAQCAVEGDFLQSLPRPTTHLLAPPWNVNLRATLDTNCTILRVPLLVPHAIRSAWLANYDPLLPVCLSPQRQYAAAAMHQQWRIRDH